MPSIASKLASLVVERHLIVTAVAQPLLCDCQVSTASASGHPSDSHVLTA